MKKLDKYLMLSWKKLWMVVVGSFLAIMIHNLFYMLFGFEEPVFFILVVIIIPFYFAIALIYSLIQILRKKKKVKLDLFISVLIGLTVAGIINYLGYFTGPWFFGLFSVLISLIVYSLVKFVSHHRRTPKNS